jgi:hypothetical protein
MANRPKESLPGEKRENVHAQTTSHDIEYEQTPLSLGILLG